MAQSGNQTSSTRDDSKRETVSVAKGKPHLHTDWSGISLLSLCCQTACYLLLSKSISLSSWAQAALRIASAHLVTCGKTLLHCYQSKCSPTLSNTRVTVIQNLIGKSLNSVATPVKQGCKYHQNLTMHLFTILMPAEWIWNAWTD